MTISPDNLSRKLYMGLHDIYVPKDNKLAWNNYVQSVSVLKEEYASKLKSIIHMHDLTPKILTQLQSTIRICWKEIDSYYFLDYRALETFHDLVNEIYCYVYVLKNRIKNGVTL